MTPSQTFHLCLLLLALLSSPAAAESPGPRRPELIRDTDIAEGIDEAAKAVPKEQNPALAKQNINIGNFYFKRKNYSAAIERYLEALAYDGRSISAHEALAKAYEKNGEPSKAIKILRSLIEKNPESPEIPEFRNRLAQMENTTD